MTRRYYPSTRERITRALDEGVKAGHRAPNPYSFRHSGRPLHDAFHRGRWLARGVDINPRRIPVVDLSAEFADMIADVEADAAKWLERAS